MTATPYPYSGPEARSRAQDALDAGRLSVHALPAKRPTAPTFPAIDELLFYVGQGREKLRLEIEAAHEQLPEALASRRKGQTDERSIAQRLRLFLDLIDKRVSELLDANNREVERRRVAERKSYELYMALEAMLDEVVWTERLHTLGGEIYCNNCDSNISRGERHDPSCIIGRASAVWEKHRPTAKGDDVKSGDAA